MLYLLLLRRMALSASETQDTPSWRNLQSEAILCAEVVFVAGASLVDA
jgi:hypothetical protein